MNVAETRLCLLLHSLTGLPENGLTRLLSDCGGLHTLAKCDKQRLLRLGFDSPQAALVMTAIHKGIGRPDIDVDAQLRTLAELGAAVVPITDPAYPPLLRTIHDPPALLYLRGDPRVLLQPQLAMVGSRKASPAGIRAAQALAGELVRAGLAITSGLALGIDGAAHRGALAAEGKTVAVIATGIDQVYPLRHRGMAAEIESSGCLVTEFPPGVPPLRQNFPRRNRIISGLSLGVLVAEAALPSGSLITARSAMEQGREVFALPWSIYHSGGGGCLYLLRDGAKMVQSVGDVLEELGSLYVLQQQLFSPGAEDNRSSVKHLTKPQRQLLQLLGYEELTVDELAQHSGMSVAAILAELSGMELDGVISRGAGGYIRN
jgi:DNA processing protein